MRLFKIRIPFAPSKLCLLFASRLFIFLIFQDIPIKSSHSLSCDKVGILKTHYLMHICLVIFMKIVPQFSLILDSILPAHQGQAEESDN